MTVEVQAVAHVNVNSLQLERLLGPSCRLLVSHCTSPARPKPAPSWGIGLVCENPWIQPLAVQFSL